MMVMMMMMMTGRRAPGAWRPAPGAMVIFHVSKKKQKSGWEGGKIFQNPKKIKFSQLLQQQQGNYTILFYYY